MASLDYMNSMINDAFTWRVTDEGHAFWSRMDFEWRTLYRKLHYILDENKRWIGVHIKS